MQRFVVTVAVLAALSACAQPGPGVDGPDPTVGATRPATEPSATQSTATPTVPPMHPSVDSYPAAHLGVLDPDGRLVEGVAVRVAATPNDRAHGLMQVRQLPAGSGMLFVFPSQRSGGFWMKNTLIPLSIAFADADGRVLAVLDMVPCESEPCEVYDPEVEYTYALEVPAGWFDDVGLTVDWRLDVPAGISASG